MYRRVLVPLDGSALAERAIAPAEGLVDPGGSIALVQVVETAPLLPPYGVGEAGSVREAEAAARWMQEATVRPRADAEAYLAEVARRIGRSDIAVTTRVLEGHPVDRLLEAAKDADIVVMSTHGRTGLARFLIGSVAERVVRHAPVPVLVVR